jgi:hypothetical protein
MSDEKAFWDTADREHQPTQEKESSDSCAAGIMNVATENSCRFARRTPGSFVGFDRTTISGENPQANDCLIRRQNLCSVLAFDKNRDQYQNVAPIQKKGYGDKKLRSYISGLDTIFRSHPIEVPRPTLGGGKLSPAELFSVNFIPAGRLFFGRILGASGVRFLSCRIAALSLETWFEAEQI